ncbi:MAG TPA: hypothetical protein DHW82_05800 [Spirochaetia bacterium]|nr:hypothetical protein [Spirochaetia bacterium]
MALIKEQAISLIQSLSSEIDFEDIHYHLYVQEKIMNSLKNSDKIKHYSEKEVKDKVQEWVKLKSSGINPL